MSELLPCPFCGSRNIDAGFALGAQTIAAGCLDCGAAGPTVPLYCQAEAYEKWNHAAKQTAALLERVRELESGIAAVQEVIDRSYGVSGLHLNGNVAPWMDLLEGGRYESWLLDFSVALNGIKEPTNEG